MCGKPATIRLDPERHEMVLVLRGNRVGSEEIQTFVIAVKAWRNQDLLSYKTRGVALTVAGPNQICQPERHSDRHDPRVPSPYRDSDRLEPYQWVGRQKGTENHIPS